jgi:hypothetical protein
MDNTTTPSQALDLLVSALEFANKSGVFTIQDAVNIAFAINTLRAIHPSEKVEETKAEGEEENDSSIIRTT